MRRALTVLMVPALLLLGSLTAFAGDGLLPYEPVTAPPAISQDAAAVIQLEDRGNFGFKSEIRPQTGSLLASQQASQAGPAAIERQRGTAPGQDPYHNHVH